ncbi:MAG: hypothetical protein AAF242_12320 [Bacteroidota bacterium]
MIKRALALKISTIVLLLAGLMDIRRGIAHTYNIRYSAEHLAGIELTSDSLVLMSAFGISNFLTGSIFLLIFWKAKYLAPYILVLIPLSYLIGGLGMQYQEVYLESRFVGRYLVAVYMLICVLTALVYFTSKKSPSQADIV